MSLYFWFLCYNNGRFRGLVQTLDSFVLVFLLRGYAMKKYELELNNINIKSYKRKWKT